MQEPDFLCDLPKCTSCNNYRNNMPKTTPKKVRNTDYRMKIAEIGRDDEFEKKKLDDLNDQITKYWDNYDSDEIGVDNATGIDVPLHLRGGSFQWNFQKRMPWYDRVTWVLTGVNVAILISLVIKNI